MGINEQILVDKEAAEIQRELIDKGVKGKGNTEIEDAYWKGAKTTLIALGIYTEREDKEKKDKQDYRDWLDYRFNKEN